MLQISVLGGVEVDRDGEVVPIPGGKTSELLVRLAVDAGTDVRADRLIEDLWGADAVNTRPNTLQSKVTRLRRALGEAELIAGSEAGYRLDVEPQSVDVHSVLRDSATAAGLVDAGDLTEAAEISSAALGRFSGEVLPGAGDAEWAAAHRRRLEEARIALLRANLAARLQLGESGEIVGELEAAVEAHPYQEALWELLITALYRGGRQADALATVRRAADRLREDLGLDPGPRLRELEQMILEQDPELDGGELAASGRGNLPAMATELVGREEETEAVIELLSHHRLVEIVGPGGIGKTALASGVGRRLLQLQDVPGGVWLVRLETAGADDVLDAAMAALNAPSPAGLFERLRRSPAVLILDNCEHVIDSAADLATSLLDAAPELRVLCTGQAPLDVEGEAVFELASLSLQHSVQLFDRRSRRAQRSTDEDGVLELCRSLDGLPLAIELAAARTRTLSIEEIARRLDDRFSLLRDPSSRRPERRRALRATIAWSYELLFPDDQRGLWALASFADGGSLAAAESVLAALDVPPSAALDVVDRLAGRSLLSVEERGHGAVRYRLLDSIRAFALEALAEAELTNSALAAHAAWYAESARLSTAGVRSARQAEFLSFARVERANIDAALGWSVPNDPPLALRIANGFGWAWIVLGDHRGGERIRRALDAVGDSAPPADRATALLLAAWIEASTDQLELAHEHIAQASAIADAAHDRELQARCAYYLSYVVAHEGDFVRALELTERADLIYRELDRPWDQAANWLFASRAAISASNLDRAREAREQVEHWLEQVDDPWLESRREAMLGELARVEHRFDDAVEHIARAAEISERLGFQQTEAYQLSSLGRAQCQAGDYPAGIDTIRLAIAKAEATGDARLATLARVHLGRVLRAVGDNDAARAELETATGWNRAAGGGEQQALGECLLAGLDAAERVPGAEERLRGLLEEARATEDAPVEVFALDALRRLAAERGDLAAARELARSADARMRAASHFIAEADRVDAAPAGSAR